MNINKQEYLNWYFNLGVQYQMFNAVKGREYAMFNKNDEKTGIRHLKITNVQGLQFWKNMLIKNKETFRPYNHYASLATYKRMPKRWGDLDLSHDRDWWKDHTQHMTGYDFLLDIDAPPGGFEWSMETAKTIKSFFDRFKVPYKLICSGRGFHFITPYNYIKPYNSCFAVENPQNIYKLYTKIATALHRQFSELIDYGIYDSRRVCRIPYSLNINNNSNAYVCFPFTSEQHFASFNEADRELFSWNKRKHLISMFKTKIFNSSGSFEPLINFIV